MATMDIFQQDAFNCISLTAAVEKVPYKPSLLGSLNLFDPRPVRTEAVAIEKRDGKLAIIQTSERGAPLDERRNEKRDIRSFRTRRIAQGDTIYAHEIQNIRAFGSDSELMQVQQEVIRRYSGATGILRNVELTWENMRLGAVQGIVTDADGSPLDNWYTSWGVAQAAEIDFALGTANTNVRGKCMQVRRQMLKASKGAMVPGTQVHALCGDAFFDAMIDHPTVRETYLNWAAAADLRGNMEYGSFTFGGITFHNYRGTDDGEMSIDTNQAKFFPVGAPGVFEVAWSPLENFDFANTPGQEVYGMLVPDRDRNMWVRAEAYSYPLFICTRPDLLQRAKRA